MKIFCENPVVLQNIRLGYFLSIWKRYQTPNGIYYISKEEAQSYRYSFPSYRFTPKRFNVNSDNIEQFNVISPDGEIYPMYIQVPCSKCLICRNRKKNEWAFRATCENVYSQSQPLFITLTYNPRNLPKTGVFKEEIQLFLKRMRIKLDRKKIEHSIRYFAVGEYGSKSGRPHYHLILWNFPTNKFHCITSVLHFIEQSWKTFTGEYNQDGSPKTTSLGYCYVKPCDKGAISYVMKYMRKEAVLPPNQNPVFFLSSRKNGGLGSRYAKEHKDFYRRNPQCLDISVTDPYSGETLTQNLPAYFKRLYFPSNSTSLNKTARDTFKKLCEKITQRMHIERILQETTLQHYTPIIYNCERKIFKKFRFLKQPFQSTPLQRNTFRGMSHDTLYKKYEALKMECINYCRYLELETYDTTYMQKRDILLKKRQRELEFKFGSLPEPNINDVKYNLYQAIKLAQAKEIL